MLNQKCRKVRKIYVEFEYSIFKFEVIIDSKLQIYDRFRGGRPQNRQSMAMFYPLSYPMPYALQVQQTTIFINYLL
jgi:hypothetical protein